MRLYKMELYKLYHRKIFILGVTCTIALVLLFFWIKVSEEYSYVDGVFYHGFQAVKMNRKITEEFKGVLTDEKAEKIVERYGFPQEAEAWCFYYQDANFLNRWVETYLSDGYYRSWDDYEVAAHIYPIAETEAGEAAAASEQELVLEYSDGWCTFFDVMTLGLIIGSIWILFGVSIVFAGEEQTKMLPLLFTTKTGKDRDIYAKIAAAYTIALGVWGSIFILDLSLCGIVYGFDGLACMSGTSKVLTAHASVYRAVTMLPIGIYMIISLFRSLLGVLLLCSVTICISACFRSSFSAVVNATLCWLSPILVWVLFVGISIKGISVISTVFRIIRFIILWLVFATPIYLVRCDAIADCYGSWIRLAAVSAAAVVICAVCAYRRYQKIAG